MLNDQLKIQIFKITVCWLIAHISTFLIPNQQIYSRLHSMSAEFDNIIANIEQKFDSEFNQQSNQTSQNYQSPDKASLRDSDNPEFSSSNLSEARNQDSVAQSTIKTPSKSDTKPSQKGNIRNIKNGKKQQRHLIQQNQGEQQQGQNKFSSVSSKLQTALRKIRSQKYEFKKFDKNKTMNLLNRFEEHQKKKQKDLEQRRNEQQEKKYLGLKQKPDINPHSRKIAQESSYKPIYQRFEQILDDKKKKSQINEETKKAKQQQEYEQFLKEYNSHIKLQKEDCRNSQTYFQDMMTWKAKLDKQKEDKLKQKEQKQIEGVTFKPLLNQKSVKLLQKTKRVPIQQRQIERPKTSNGQYTFKPYLKKRKGN